MNRKTHKKWNHYLNIATHYILEWMVKRLGGTNLHLKISVLSFLTFVGLCVTAIEYPKFMLNSVFGQVLIGLLTTSIVSLIGTVFWFASSKYREREFTIHIFNYAPSVNVRPKRKRLALEISEGVQTETEDAYFSHKSITAEDESTLRVETALEFVSRNHGHIAIVPFMEIAKTIGEIFDSPSSVPNNKWAHQSENEVARTFAIFVTYDPGLENRLNNVKNLRFFSTPLIDVAAMFNDMIDSEATHIVLLPETEGEFQVVESALLNFVRRKEARLKRLAALTKKNTLPALELDKDYAPAKHHRICLFVMSVDPSESILERIKKIIAQATEVGASVDIYVPPTWMRNWLINESNKWLLPYWDDWFSGRKLTTVLPEGVVAHETNWLDAGPCFDIILYYTKKAIDLAKAVRREVQKEGGTPYDKTADVLDQKVQSILRAWSVQPEYCFLAAFEHGDLFYEPVIVKFSPNAGRSNFIVELGKRSIATTQASPSASINPGQAQGQV